MNLADLRREYARAALDEGSVDPDPHRQLLGWLEDATRAEVLEPSAMVLATASEAGVPSARVVLLKGAEAGGLTFFCDTRSQKGSELTANPVAAVVFWWGELERQVRVNGIVTRVSDAEANAYFVRRPPGSRISAWASHQSQVVPDRAVLEARWAEAAKRFGEAEIPRPPYWSGFRIAPVQYEFWQGRPNRLHDRLRYRLSGGKWIIERLSP
jgi:pyridoxamine 5'-phosphate oxidase